MQLRDRPTCLRFVVGLGLCLVACSRGAPGTPFAQLAPTAPSGAYEFVANLPGGHRMQGMIAILRDTIILDATEGRCKPVMDTPDVNSIVYECLSVGRYDVVLFTLDRRNAVQRSRWAATERVVRSRRVCAQYAIRSGRRVCVRYSEETYEDSVRSSGTVELTPRNPYTQVRVQSPESRGEG